MFQQVATWSRDTIPALHGAPDGAIVALVLGAVFLVGLGVWDTLRRW